MGRARYRRRPDGLHEILPHGARPLPRLDLASLLAALAVAGLLLVAARSPATLAWPALAGALVLGVAWWLGRPHRPPPPVALRRYRPIPRRGAGR